MHYLIYKKKKKKKKKKKDIYSYINLYEFIETYRKIVSIILIKQFFDLYHNIITIVIIIYNNILMYKNSFWLVYFNKLKKK